MAVVSGTIESAERVVAHRAEKGKELSQVNAEGLVELRNGLEKLRTLLNDSEEVVASEEPSTLPPSDEVLNHSLAQLEAYGL
jgi:hypothetical protein